MELRGGGLESVVKPPAEVVVAGTGVRLAEGVEICEEIRGTWRRENAGSWEERREGGIVVMEERD